MYEKDTRTDELCDAFIRVWNERADMQAALEKLAADMAAAIAECAKSYGRAGR